jgi:hypothetical protein
MAIVTVASNAVSLRIKIEHVLTLTLLRMDPGVFRARILSDRSQSLGYNSRLNAQKPRTTCTESDPEY